MVAHLHRGHPRAHLADNAGTLVTEDRGENAFAVEAVQRVGVGVANPRRLDLHQHLAGLRTLQIKLHNLKRLLRLKRDGGACLHLALLLRSSPQNKVVTRAALIPDFRAVI